MDHCNILIAYQTNEATAKNDERKLQSAFPSGLLFGYPGIAVLTATGYDVKTVKDYLQNTLGGRYYYNVT